MKSTDLLAQVIAEVDGVIGVKQSARTICEQSAPEFRMIGEQGAQRDVPHL